MTREVVHRAISAYLYYVLAVAGLGVTTIAGVLASSLISSGWGTVLGLFVAFIVGGGVLRFLHLVRRWRANAFYRMSFPLYRGKRFPAFHLVSAHGPGFAKRYDASHTTHSIADGGDTVFILEATRSSRPHEIAGGAILRHPASRDYWRIDKERIAAIDVIEFDDAAIKAAAVDTMSDAERLIGVGINHLLGVSSKRKIVPFAAFVVITLAGEEGHEQLTFAVPTEISAETIKSIGVTSEEDADELVQAAIDNAIGRARSAATDAAHDEFGQLIGDTGLSVFDGVVDIKHDIDFLLNAGKARIATTDGRRGRMVARLIAERIREYSGVASVGVERLAPEPAEAEAA